MSNVILRDYETRDLDALMAIRNDEELQHLLLAHPRAQRDGDVLAWIARRSGEPGGLFKIIAVDDTCAGFVQIADVHRLDRRAHLGIAVVKAYRGGGVGKRAMQLALEQAHRGLKLRKILVEVRADNGPAISLYTQLGFRNAGVLAAHYTGRGAPDDVVVLELLFDDGAAL